MSLECELDICSVYKKLRRRKAKGIRDDDLQPFQCKSIDQLVEQIVNSTKVQGERPKSADALTRQMLLQVTPSTVNFTDLHHHTTTCVMDPSSRPASPRHSRRSRLVKNFSMQKKVN